MSSTVFRLSDILRCEMCVLWKILKIVVRIMLLRVGILFYNFDAYCGLCCMWHLVLVEWFTGGGFSD